MTRERLDEILAVWMGRLNLAHWNIRFSDKAPDTADAEAEIHVHDDYEQATIRLGPPWQNWSERDAHATVVHELLHCFERGTKQTVMALDPATTAVVPRAVYELTLERYRHESEGWIDRLAFILVDLAGS